MQFFLFYLGSSPLYCHKAFSFYCFQFLLIYTNFFVQSFKFHHHSNYRIRLWFYLKWHILFLASGDYQSPILLLYFFQNLFQLFFRKIVLFTTKMTLCMCFSILIYYFLKLYFSNRS